MTLSHTQNVFKNTPFSYQSLKIGPKIYPFARSLPNPLIYGSGHPGVEGTMARGRPRKSWLEVVKSDLRAMGLQQSDALNRLAWREAIYVLPD